MSLEWPQSWSPATIPENSLSTPSVILHPLSDYLRDTFPLIWTSQDKAAFAKGGKGQEIAARMHTTFSDLSVYWFVLQVVPFHFKSHKCGSVDKGLIWKFFLQSHLYTKKYPWLQLQQSLPESWKNSIFPSHYNVLKELFTTWSFFLWHNEYCGNYSTCWFVIKIGKLFGLLTHVWTFHFKVNHYNISPF